MKKPSLFVLTIRTGFAYGNHQSPECCPRPRRHAPESTNITLLPFVLPYRESGTLARSVYYAPRVSAGVSRKSVHLFRWGSYFHKAFTGTKTTTSRERLPNPLLQRRGLHTCSLVAAPCLSKSSDRPAPEPLYACHPHPLLPISRTERVHPAWGKPIGYNSLCPTNDYPVACFLPPAVRHQDMETRTVAAMAALSPCHGGGSPHRPRNKEYRYGPTHCRSS